MIPTFPFAYKRPDPTGELLAAIDACCREWREDPAMNDVRFKLERAREELDWLGASAGRRAVLRSAMPNHAGQTPERRSEGLGGA